MRDGLQRHLMTRRRVIALAGAALGTGLLAGACLNDQRDEQPTPPAPSGSSQASLDPATSPDPTVTAQTAKGIEMTAEPTQTANPLTPPASGTIPVAFMLSQGATMIDFAGPWEVFQDVPGPKFRLYTVSASLDPFRATGGMQIIPDYTFEDAPEPKVVVIPAQSAASPAYGEWLRHVHGSVDVMMSVCTGAFILGKAGLLDGRAATTHHNFFNQFEAAFPDVELRRGLRFVEGPAGDPISSAGGLTSGIDLALRVVERYFGREVAQRTADYMEYQSTGWKTA